MEKKRRHVVLVAMAIIAATIAAAAVMAYGFAWLAWFFTG